MSVDSHIDARIAAALDDLRHNPPPPRLALNLEEAGRAVGVSGRTVRRWIDAGLLPTVPHTTRTLVPVVALEAFVLSDPEDAEGVPALAPTLPAIVGAPCGPSGSGCVEGEPAEAELPEGAIGADPRGGGSVSPLPASARGAGDRRGPRSTARGDSTPPAA